MVKIKKTFFIVIAVYLFAACSLVNKTDNSFPLLSGPYLGQTPPGDEPEIFAPGIVSTAMTTRDITMTPDGNEIYFCISALGYNLIFCSKKVNGVWTEPAPAPFITEFDKLYFEPHITPDGKRMLFLSNMRLDAQGKPCQDIWAVDREGDSWGKPYNLGAPVCSDNSEFFPSTTKDGTLYFTRREKGSRVHYIYRSRLIDGKYQEPERLGPNVNCGISRFNAFIDPDERFIIVPVIGIKDAVGGTDYYIVFRDENDKWSKPINLGSKINQANGREFSPYMSPDGKYFFFMSSRVNKPETFRIKSYKSLLERFLKPGNGNSGIYWVKSDFLFKLRKKNI